MALSETTAERLQTMRDHLRAEPWSVALEKRLAAEWGVTRRRVRQIKLQAAQAIYEEIQQGGAALATTEILLSLDRGAAAAEEAGKFHALRGLRQLQARMTGTLDPIKQPEPDELDELDRDSLLEALAEDMDEAEVEDLLRRIRARRER